MSKVYADKIEPRDSTMDVTIGTSTNTVTLAGNDIRANTVKDSGGNTLWVSDGSGNLSSVNSGLRSSLNLLSTQTASSASSVSFTTGIDSTYNVYIFKFIEINPASNNEQFSFQCSTDGGSNYNVTMTTTFWEAYHRESDASAGLSYFGTYDQAQGTAFQQISFKIANFADASASGSLHLFAPSSATYVKHFQSRSNTMDGDSETVDSYAAGYLNTATALNAIQFKMTSGNFDGIIKMYGLD